MGRTKVTDDELNSTKLDGIEAAATADQTDAEIKTAYENNANTNAFNDASSTKLATIETSADVTGTTNVNSAGAVMENDYNSNTMLIATSDNTPVASTKATIRTFVGVGNAIKVLSQASTDLVVADTHVYGDTVAANKSVTMPVSSTLFSGHIVYVKNTSAGGNPTDTAKNELTLAGEGTDTIDMTKLYPGEWCELIWDLPNTNWVLLDWGFPADLFVSQRQNAALTIANSTVTSMTFPNKVDLENPWNLLVADVPTIDRPGRWNLFAPLFWATNATGARMVRGVAISTAFVENRTPAVSGTETRHFVTAAWKDGVKGDLFKVELWQNSGGNLNTAVGVGSMRFELGYLGRTPS